MLPGLSSAEDDYVRRVSLAVIQEVRGAELCVGNLGSEERVLGRDWGGRRFMGGPQVWVFE